MIDPLESKVQKKILDYIGSVGYVVKIISATKSGVPDTIACINGKFYAFEIKRSEDEEASPLQEYNIEQIEKAGGHAFVVWSVKQVKEIINGSHAASNSES
jgi:Holliday junction resolvase